APRRVRIPDIKVTLRSGNELTLDRLLHGYVPGDTITLDGVTVVNPVAIGIASPTIVDVMAARLFMYDLGGDVAATGTPPPPLTPLTATQIRQQLRLMLPFEIRHGQKMDINRLFGNGDDDNGNVNTNSPVAVADEGSEGTVPSGTPAPSNKHEPIFGTYTDL